jgi:hypothetical protein
MWLTQEESKILNFKYGFDRMHSTFAPSQNQAIINWVSMWQMEANKGLPPKEIFKMGRASAVLERPFAALKSPSRGQKAPAQPRKEGTGLASLVGWGRDWSKRSEKNLDKHDPEVEAGTHSPPAPIQGPCSSWLLTPRRHGHS